MRYLLDTCVISELVRPHPDQAVASRVRMQNELDLHLSVLTIGEIQKGIGRLPASPRRAELELWLREELAGRFAGRLLAVDAEITRVWGRVQPGCTTSCSSAATRPISTIPLCRR